MRAADTGVSGGRAHTGFSPSAGKAVYSQRPWVQMQACGTVVGCHHLSPKALGECVSILWVRGTLCTYSSKVLKKSETQDLDLSLQLVQNLRSALEHCTALTCKNRGLEPSADLQQEAPERHSSVNFERSLNRPPTVGTCAAAAQSSCPANCTLPWTWIF